MDRIDTAAIKYFDLGVVTLPRPARHHDIIWHVWENHSRRTMGMDKQGFVTESGDFVDRREGWKIALAAGQIINQKDGPSDILFSEYMW